MTRRFSALWIVTVLLLGTVLGYVAFIIAANYGIDVTLPRL